MLSTLNSRLQEKRLSLTVTKSAKEFIAREGYDPVYGARPLRRFIQRVVETEIAKRIIANEFLPGEQITVDFDGEGLVFYAK